MKKIRASLRGAAVRELIRLAVGSPGLKNGGLFTAGAKWAGRKSTWKCPEDSLVRKVDCCGAPAELLTLRTGGRNKAILQLHGGAYLIGFSDMYRNFACRFLRLSGGAAVLSLDYRIAPEYAYPAALDDAESAWKWLLENGYKAEDIIVAGDSAGGNLALALTLRLRENGRDLPNGLVLMSPWADMTSAVPSRTLNYKKDPMFGKRAGEEGAAEIKKPGNPYAGGADLSDIHLSPAFAGLAGFPPMLIQVGDWEMLLDDARAVARNAWKAGVDATLMEYPGMFHVFQAASRLPESRNAWAAVGAFLGKRFGDRQKV
jgi:acetyl esterase/lipase